MRDGDPSMAVAGVTNIIRRNLLHYIEQAVPTRRILRLLCPRTAHDFNELERKSPR